MYDYTDNDLAWLFFISSASFYVALGIIGPLPGPDPVLFVEILSHAKSVPVLWGWIGLISLATSVIGMATYNEKIIKIFSATQVSLWVYAGVSYITAGTLPLFTGIALVHILFWSWNYSKRKTVRNRRAKREWLDRPG